MLLISTAIVANAHQVTPDEARLVATEFFSKTTVAQTAKGHNLHLVKRRSDRRESIRNPYYVFNADGDAGFVIISGDDRAKKILGFSESGRFDFDNLPPQLSTLLDQYSEQLETIPSTRTQDSSWQSIAEVAEDVVLLNTANWGQGYPFNTLCPIIDGVQAPTGCVATAMAIVMRYNNWPENYNWNAMPLDDISEDSGAEIARLMVDGGNSVYMDYGAVESGANMNWVGHKLQQDFNYSPECQYITSQNFNNDEWKQLIYQNLENGYPVLYSGVDKEKSVGHAFVIDGYNDLGFHINWGWDGLYNGYYDLEAFNPGENNFNSESGMVINIIPDKSGQEYSKCFVDYGYFYDSRGSGFFVNSNELSNSTPIDFSLSKLNYQRGEKGEYALVLTDCDGKIKDFLLKKFYDATYPQAPIVVGESLSFVNILTDSPIADNDIIALYTRDSSSIEWKRVLGTIEAPTEMPVSCMMPKTAKISFEFDEDEFIPMYWKGSNDSGFHTVSNGEEVSLVYGLSNVQFSCLDKTSGSSYPDDQIIINIENASDGEIYEWRSASAAFSCFDDLHIRISSLRADKSVELTVNEPGTLHALIGDMEVSKIGNLKIKGNINAKDLWYIRDNLTNIKELDLSGVSIHGCDELDPVNEFREPEQGTQFPANNIPRYGLANLYSLSKLMLPEEVTTIQDNAFQYSSIELLELPKQLKYLGNATFYGNSNLRILICKSNLPASLGNSAFNGTSLSSNSIMICPDGSKSEYENEPLFNIFSEILEDSDINVNCITQSFDGVVYTMVPFGASAIGYVQDEIDTENVVIPDELKFGKTNRKIIEIGENAFEFCTTNEFRLPRYLKKIGPMAFMFCAMNQINLPDDLSEIHTYAFGGCYNIKEMILPETVTFLDYAFYECTGLEHLYIPKITKGSEFNRYQIGSGFKMLEKFEVDPENEMWSVHEGALYSKDMTTLFNCPGQKYGTFLIPETVEKVETFAFSRCDLLKEIRFKGDFVECSYVSMSMGNEAIIDHIEFPQITTFSNTECLVVNGLKSVCLGDFSVVNLGGVKLGAVDYFLKNKDFVSFAEDYIMGCSESRYFLSGMEDNVSLPSDVEIFVPGGTRHIYKDHGENIHEMWKYELDRDRLLLHIDPEIEGISIDSVKINGITSKIITDNFYELPASDDLEIDVHFTLFDRQAMSTHYSAKFNSQLDNTELTIPTKVESIEITPSEIDDVVGKEYQLKVIVSPDNANNKDVVWSSDDEDVAMVDEKGLVKLLGKGTTIVTALAKDGSGIFAECHITVDILTGINSIMVPKDTEVRIYNLAGVLVFKGTYADANLQPGIYSIVTPNSTFKTQIK